MKNLALKVSAWLFLVIALLHLVRVIFKVVIIVGGYAVPVWISVLGFVAAILLSLGMWMAVEGNGGEK